MQHSIFPKFVEQIKEEGRKKPNSKNETKQKQNLPVLQAISNISWHSKIVGIGALPFPTPLELISLPAYKDL